LHFLIFFYIYDPDRRLGSSTLIIKMHCNRIQILDKVQQPTYLCAIGFPSFQALGLIHYILGMTMIFAKKKRKFTLILTIPLTIVFWTFKLSISLSNWCRWFTRSQSYTNVISSRLIVKVLPIIGSKLSLIVNSWTSGSPRNTIILLVDLTAERTVEIGMSRRSRLHNALVPVFARDNFADKLDATEH
jgi:hypothetical protein